jgi:hypothetical protein
VAPEPEGSSPHSQQPATGPYPEQTESTPHPNLPKIHFDPILPSTPRSSEWFLSHELSHRCQRTCPADAPNIPCTISHTHFQALRSCQRIRPGPRLRVMFRNILWFLQWVGGVVSPHPTPKLEDHPLSVVCDCLFNTFAATLHIWRSSPLSAT